MNKTIKIEGMSCNHCVGAVTKALTAITGVSDVKVDLETKSAKVTLLQEVQDDILKEAIEDAGYDVISIA